MKNTKLLLVFVISCVVFLMVSHQVQGNLATLLGLKLLLRLKHAVLIPLPIPLPVRVSTSGYNSLSLSSYSSPTIEYSDIPWNSYETNELWNNYGSTQHWNTYDSELRSYGHQAGNYEDWNFEEYPTSREPSYHQQFVHYPRQEGPSESEPKKQNVTESFQSYEIQPKYSD